VSEKPEGRRSYGKLAKVGLVWGALRQGGNTLLALPTAMILARLLTPAEAGVAAAAYFFMQLGARLSQFGLGAALVRARKVERAHLASVFVLNLIFGGTAWLTLTLAAPFAGRFLSSPDAASILPTAAYGYLIMAFGTVPTAILSREMRYRESTTSAWLSALAESATTVTLAWMGFSYWSIVYGRLTGDASSALARAVMVRWLPDIRFTRAAMREMFNFGAGVYAKNLLDYAAENLDNLLVARFLGVTSLGFYDKAFNTASKFTGRINMAGPSISFRVFAIIHEEPERFRRAYRKVILGVTSVGYPVLTGMIVAGSEVIEVLFGHRWLDAAMPFKVLCLVGMLKLVNTYASTATQAKGRIWSEVQRQTVFVALLVLAVSFGSRWGIAGAAGGVLAATVFNTYLLQSLVKRLAGLNWSDIVMPQIPGVVSALGLALTLVAVRFGIAATLPDAGALERLGAFVAVALLYQVTFLKIARFPDLRAMVRETVDDLPPVIGQRLQWLDGSRAGGRNR
jgi:PST family polysaccharide transporter